MYPNVISGVNGFPSGTPKILNNGFNKRNGSVSINDNRSQNSRGNNNLTNFDIRSKRGSRGGGSEYQASPNRTPIIKKNIGLKYHK